MYTLPTTVKIRDNDFKIRNKGDFRMVLDCFNALQDDNLSQQERVISSLIIFYDDVHSYEDLCVLFKDDEDLKLAIEKMYEFFNCNQKEVGAKQNYKLIDWDNDSQIICSAINNVANIEIRSLEYLHWWTFMGYYICRTSPNP